ncbi:hypothetical protein [Streptomyces sp. NPDC047042]|uniref:hypothetical protein n=1 Tax=Streptomyces sp. NPDC047042 TaxID=3154807 RepID=UPI0033D01A60
MTFIEFPGWQPGMIVTEERANSAALVGRTIFRATRDTNQSISSTGSGNPDVANALAWESVPIDDLGGWSSGAATRYTIQLAGYYKIRSKVSFNATATPGTARAMGIFGNGTQFSGGHFRTALAATNSVHTEDGFVTALLAVGDYVQIAPGHSTGSALDTATGGSRPTIEIEFARPA